MKKGKYIGYLRVSTDRQGKSGLGLEAQREAIENFINGGKWILLKEFVEIESGKKNDRPQLKAALELCRKTGAKLVIAKLDRLARNVAFIANLMESNVDFVACDFPEANRLTIHILAAVAEYEREMISKRTKEALRVAKARGVKLGSPENLGPEAAERGRRLGVESRVNKADSFAREHYPDILQYRERGMSLNAIADKMNKEGVLTARGKVGSWTATAVKNITHRVIRNNSIERAEG